MRSATAVEVPDLVLPDDLTVPGELAAAARRMYLLREMIVAWRVTPFYGEAYERVYSYWHRLSQAATAEVTEEFRARIRREDDLRALATVLPRLAGRPVPVFGNNDRHILPYVAASQVGYLTHRLLLLTSAGLPRDLAWAHLALRPDYPARLDGTHMGTDEGEGVSCPYPAPDAVPADLADALEW